MGIVCMYLVEILLKLTLGPISTVAKCSLVFIVECTVVEVVITVHHAKKTLTSRVSKLGTKTGGRMHIATYARNGAKSAPKRGMG